MTKLTDDGVREIKMDLAAKELTQAQIAVKHNMSRSTISDIATGRIHKDVEMPPNDIDDNKFLKLQAEIVHLREK